MKEIRHKGALLTSLFVFALVFILGAADTSVYVVTVQLKNSTGDLLAGGSLRYYDGSWNTADPNPDGTFTVTTPAASLTYEMTYSGGTQTQSNIPTSTTPVVFQTLSVKVQLKNSQGQLMDPGTVQYYGGTWMDFGSTSGGEVVKELLPYNYKFRMSYATASIEKY